MAHIDPMIIGRNMNGENRAEITNIAKLTLSNAAAATGEAVRYDEYNVDVTDLQSRVTAVENSAGHIDQVYVDTTSADLATAVGLATYDAGTGHWTFGAKELSVGDILILNAATQQDSDRAWILNGAEAGTVADFTAMGSDVDAAIAAAIAGVVGGASAGYDTLGEIETIIIALDTRVDTAETNITSLQTDQAKRPEQRDFSGTFTGPVDGVYTATIAHTFNTSKLNYNIQHLDAGSVWADVGFGVDYQVKVDDDNFYVKTESAGLAVALRIIATGIEA